jgi:hypothetical protein
VNAVERSASSLGRFTPVLIGYDTMWVTDFIWTLQRRENLTTVPGVCLLCRLRCLGLVTLSQNQAVSVASVSSASHVRAYPVVFSRVGNFKECAGLGLPSVAQFPCLFWRRSVFWFKVCGLGYRLALWSYKSSFHSPFLGVGGKLWSAGRWSFCV